MAICGSQPARDNIPDYEYIDVNTLPFNIGAFRDAWLERLKPENYSYEEQQEDAFEAEFTQAFGISAETLSGLRSLCRQRKRRQDYKANLKIDKINRHEHYVDELEKLTVGRKPNSEDSTIPEGEVIITVNVYYPCIFERFKHVRPHMTMLMTGSHTLADLKDAICCVSDLQVGGEFSNTPNIAPDFISKDYYKSCFFFLEGVFYNDMRFPECQDISSTTVEWAKSHNFPSYRKAKMQDTKFIDLEIKVGFPYLYCHQGDCEHLVIITDIRQVLWLTTNDQFAPCDPCLFCDKCFQMLHYSVQGNKLGDFLAYPYVDPGAFN
ncbi:hypothetical protein NHX12_018388 [Muraenolepis orangiensis]|uniref:snRNA-activating protein complex subunit 3 n=1 Tax=Muraenolepis orangiensis TaxID=630683 RepID=A0A9Q0IYH5_9TELE|nr:hypothetical protein NHX12_018388 [Muraenolepis orangiensis]